MDKDTFIKTLKEGLKGLPKEEAKELIEDYEEHFRIGKRKKRTEASIAKGLGNPKTIARQAKAEHLVRKAEERRSASNVLRAVFATVSLGFFNIIFILGPFFALVGVLIALIATGIAVAVSGIGVLLASVLWPALPLGIKLNLVQSMGAAFAGIGTTALGGLILMGDYYLAKWFAKGTIAYLKLNTRIIKGKED